MSPRANLMAHALQNRSSNGHEPVAERSVVMDHPSELYEEVPKAAGVKAAAGFQ